MNWVFERSKEQLHWVFNYFYCVMTQIRSVSGALNPPYHHICHIRSNLSHCIHRICSNLSHHIHHIRHIRSNLNHYIRSKLSHHILNFSRLNRQFHHSRHPAATMPISIFIAVAKVRKMCVCIHCWKRKRRAIG